MKKVCEIDNFEEFVDLNLQEKVTRIPDVNDFHQNALHFFLRKWEIPGSDIRGDAFLSNGLFILTDYMYMLRRCALFSEDMNILRELKLGYALQ